MRRWDFIKLLGLIGCSDDMFLAQHGILSKVGTGSTLLVGMIGDSMGDGVGATLGPTVPYGAMQAWDGSAFQNITTTDIANFAGTRGTPYKQFALDYNNRHGGMIKFVNRCLAGSFLSTAASNNWDPASGTSIYPAAKTEFDQAVAAAGTPFDYIIVNCGINDANGATAMATIKTSIDNLFTQLQTDYPGVPILIIQIGSSTNGVKLNNPRQYEIRRKLRERALTLTNVTIVFNNSSCWQAGPALFTFVQVDDTHLTQAGNNLLGTSLANYHDAVLAGRSQRAAGEIGCILMDNPGDIVPVGYANAFSTLIDALVTDGNYPLLETLYLLNGVSKNQACASGVSLFGTLWFGNQTWTQYRNWAFDGVDDYHVDAHFSSLDGLGATTSDHLVFTRLASNDNTPPLNAALWGKQEVSGATRQLAMLRQNAATNVSYNTLNGSGSTTLGSDAVFAVDVLYTAIRNGTTTGLYKGGTLDTSATAAIATLSVINGLYRMCFNAVGSLVQFFAGKVQVIGFGKYTGMDITKLNTAIANYVTAVKLL